LLDPMLRFIDVDISWQVQEEPLGIPEAFIICRGFIGTDDVTLILGDNIFGDIPTITKVIKNFKGGGHILAKKSLHPNRFGVVILDNNGDVLDIIEKPLQWISDFVIPGLYTFDANVTEIAMTLTASKRGELEITEVHNAYLRDNQLSVTQLAEDSVWMDAGTHKSYARATDIVRDNTLLQNFHTPLVDAINQFAPYENFDFHKVLCY
jgi:glucose-1-phosphate thymidylyltransferase